MTALGLDEISTFAEGKVVKIFFGFTMLTQKNVQFILARLLLYYTRNDTKVAQPEFVDITGLMVNEH